jgi:hypothetical protein
MEGGYVCLTCDSQGGSPLIRGRLTAVMMDLQSLSGSHILVILPGASQVLRLRQQCRSAVIQ